MGNNAELKRDINRLDSSGLTYVDGDKANLATTTGTELSVLGGRGIIYNRDIFGVNIRKDVIWSPQTIDLNDPLKANGRYIGYIDGDDGIFKLYSTSAGSLPPYSSTSPNMSEDFQVCFFNYQSGVFSEFELNPNISLNQALRLFIRTRSLGFVNWRVNPILISPNGTNIKINSSAGQIVGIAFAEGGIAGNYTPDLKAISSTTTPLIYRGDRTQTIYGASTDLKVDQYENPAVPGSFITLGNTKAMNVFLYYFPAVGFIAIQGTKEYLSLALAFASVDEPPTYLPLLSAGIALVRISVVAPCTNLSSSSQALFKLLKQLWY